MREPPNADVIERLVAASTAASGVPPRLNDPVTARRIAALITARPREASNATT